MTWLTWVWIGVIVASLSFFGYVIYSLLLSGKALKTQIEVAQKQVDQALGNIESEITPAQPHTEADLVQLVQARRQLHKAKAERKEKRQRRLVARLRDIEIDKRFL
ncbi:MAG: hypothetical protein RIS51_75 [Actinomycetota bacterium]|jgi:cysteine sulfinate desulfinase/cysteine desulfurase-like protein